MHIRTCPHTHTHAYAQGAVLLDASTAYTHTHLNACTATHTHAYTQGAVLLDTYSAFTLSSSKQTRACV